MGRIRTIKPEFPQSETIGRLTREGRLLFLQLFTLVDDSGRTRAASRMLASLLYPYDDDAPKLVDKWLCDLEENGVIIRYEVEGNLYLEICNWSKHQKIDKPSPSKFPSFDESSRILANGIEPSRTVDDVSRIKDQGMDQGPFIMSGKPDALNLGKVFMEGDSKRAENKLRKEEARAVLDFLNLKTGKRFEPNDTNLGLIESRMKEGASRKECKQVIARKCSQWLYDEKMCMYLRPATLFNKTKFSQYKGELEVEDQQPQEAAI